MIGLFNAIGRPRVSFFITAATAIANALFNGLFVFRLGWRVAGTAWARDVAQAVICDRIRPVSQSGRPAAHKSHLGWRAHKRLIASRAASGCPWA